MNCCGVGVRVRKKVLEDWRPIRKGCFFPDGLLQTGNLDSGVAYPGKKGQPTSRDALKVISGMGMSGQ